MSSKRRIEASRQNGALSKGPKTAAGKSRSSQNAYKHGILAKRTVLPNEREDDFLELLDQYVEKFHPRDGVEFGFVEEMANSYWRYHRALAIEQNLFEEAFEKHLDCQDMSLTRHAWKDLTASGDLQTLHRYQMSLHRMYQRAMHNLLVLRGIDPKKVALRNEPNPKSGHSDAPAPPEPPAPESAPGQPSTPQSPAADPPPPAPPPPNAAVSPASFPNEPLHTPADPDNTVRPHVDPLDSCPSPVRDNPEQRPPSIRA